MNKLLSIIPLATMLLLAQPAWAQYADVEPPAENSKIVQLLQQISALEAEEDHCEVPCGIYGDSLRTALMYEHIRTIDKASKQIIELSAQKNPNYNQLVRWVVNKEKHAEEVQHIAAQYFLHQRIKPKDAKDGKAHAKYLKHLEALHRIQVLAMKCKQSTDVVNVTGLRMAVKIFEDLYFHTH
ncbi:MAG: superoxide dismutase [Ni] [Bacteroidota bacterium]